MAAKNTTFSRFSPRRRKSAPEPEGIHGPPAGGPVVVAVSGSPASSEPLEWAAAEAAARGTSLRIVHSFAVPVLVNPLAALPAPTIHLAVFQSARAVLDRAVRQARHIAPDVVVTEQPHAGSPVDGILAEAGGAALIVVGRRGGGRARHLRRRSRALRLAHRSGVPIVVVALAPEQVSGPSRGRVVVGVRAAGDAEGALDFAFEAARRRGVGVTVVQAWTPQIADLDHDALRAVASAQCRALVATLVPCRSKYPHVDLRLRFATVPPWQALLEESAGAAMIVLGVRNRRGPSAGLTTTAVLRHATSPVALVP
jgi:nucleotide-binding universal stress UspA family protein